MKRGYITYLSLPSRGPRTGRNRYVTPAFSGALRRGYKTTSGCITLAFSVVHKWAELLHKTCVLGGALKRGQNKKGVKHSHLLGVRAHTVGGIAM